METTFTKIKSKNEESEIIAKVFPVNHAVNFQDRVKQVHGCVDDWVEKISQRQISRMFGKVRSFLKRAMIPRTSPLPSTANTARMSIKTNA